MRLRNVKGASAIIESSDYIIKDYKEYKGKYKELFNNDNPIHIEIGMGKGDFIIGMAKKYPKINFIGIEKFDSVIVRAIEKIDEEIPNLKLIRMDATEIEEVFDKEIDCIYLNFSDPWPKKRHADRRLTSLKFLKRYDCLFKGEKNVIMKTDNRKLFEFSLISFTNYNYKIEEISLDLYNDDIKDNVATEYEKKFHSLGFPIYKIIVKK
ncbi:MAG: tRNA (guanosine(46)-N7)-methyltransferase TrmB [Bacilli bacterium]|nr:tRNA (guanosine(46)-N7)-methyltransferase TrmB [Bacilli bacterium]